MNRFDQVFFKKYIAKDSIIIDIAHRHIIVILEKIIINYFFWVIFPTFIYYNSLSIQSLIPFFVLEIFILLIFFKNIYDVFDWYNDVWIITQDEVVDLNWEFFSFNSVSVKYASIEGLEIMENWIIDTILGKWDIKIHKIGWENSFILKNASNAYKTLDKIDQILKDIKSKSHKNSTGEQNKNFETVIEALSWVVEDYLWRNGYKKDDSIEKKELIEKIKKRNWTIDLSN